MMTIGQILRLQAEVPDKFATASYIGTRPSGIPRLAYTILDLTERKRAEEQLRQSEERYRTLFDTLIEGF